MLKFIDISKYQLIPIWGSIKEDGVIMKATEGIAGRDPMLTSNQREFRKEPIGVGYYHFSDGGDAVAEADYFLKQVGDLEVGEVLALDFEIHLTNTVEWCEQFVQRIFDKTEQWPMFYSYVSIIALFPADSIVVKNCPLWVADPSGNAEPRIGNWKTWSMWQWTTAPAGQVTGISTTCDLDYFNGTIEEFKKLGKAAPVSVPVAPVQPIAQISQPVETVTEVVPTTEAPAPEIPTEPETVPIPVTIVPIQPTEDLETIVRGFFGRIAYIYNLLFKK